ncbi:hypothetical protein [Companilactobacillus ginsenosidimutans]|uniref:Uncharacterized protein n=1 Tax=Companilactobacillus ginsenosidimutans TaxID=1007676 RepID=A0A0H4QJ57_9LACO|nr:hypothetical protein [Companilactobacillus ginsenosidimutans]AKP67952.1 hypothetical protein ABM34_10705 [Companilactobacillus ginsenosidimutans]
MFKEVGKNSRLAERKATKEIHDNKIFWKFAENKYLEDTKRIHTMKKSSNKNIAERDSNTI